MSIKKKKRQKEERRKNINISQENDEEKQYSSKQIPFEGERIKFSQIDQREKEGIVVVRRSDERGNKEPIERLIKRFKKKVLKDGVLKEVVFRIYYKTPSEIKKIKRKESEDRLRREERFRLKKQLKRGRKVKNQNDED